MNELSEYEINYFKQLYERQQRLFAGLKAKALGRGGVQIVSSQLGISAHTVRRGKLELEELPESAPKRIRKSGGGAKKNEYPSSCSI